MHLADLEFVGDIVVLRNSSTALQSILGWFDLFAKHMKLEVNLAKTKAFKINPNPKLYQPFTNGLTVECILSYKYLGWTLFLNDQGKDGMVLQIDIAKQALLRFRKTL